MRGSANNPHGGSTASETVYGDYARHYSRPASKTELVLLESLRTRHPDYHVTVVPVRQCNLIPFAAAGKAKFTKQMDDDAYETHRDFALPVRRLDQKDGGKLVDHVKFAKYKYTHNGFEFLLYIIDASTDYNCNQYQYVLAPRNLGTIADGHHSAVDALVLEAGKWGSELHEEIYTFDQGMWQKSPDLWKSVKDATWDEVILDDAMKASLIDDVEGFFDKEDVYREFSVPWKRGIIFHGVPGNGKTMSLRALIRSLYSRPTPIPSLYVKSFETQGGVHQFAIQSIFTHARSMAPCLLIFEDIDSLVQESCRSYFLNEVDGLESNDGILIVGSTNHLARLDPSIVNRPSRFDRKYHFPLPSAQERAAYARDWRRRLAKNPRIDFPDAACPLIARLTEGFSFAYMKELFISTMLTIARGAGDSVDALAPLDEKAEKVALPELDVPEELAENVVLRVARHKAKVLIAEMDNSRGDKKDEKEEEGKVELPVQLKVEVKAEEKGEEKKAEEDEKKDEGVQAGESTAA